jgi:hypothetical protein
MFARLLDEQLRIVSGREGQETETVGQIFDNFDGARPDGAGGAEEDNVFHRRFTSSGHAVNKGT